MALTLLMGGGNSELLADLKHAGNFEDMQQDLERSLRSMEAGMLGSSISLDIGTRRLTERQLRQLEELLQNYGLHLNNLFTGKNGPEQRRSGLVLNQPATERVEADTILISRHLRSGQRFFSHGNIVVRGDVNPGAELIAGGDILVMGWLRGMVHAGAFGNEDAVIAALRFNPVQLRIARHITRPPDGEEENCSLLPELARIKDGKVVIERI